MKNLTTLILAITILFAMPACKKSPSTITAPLDCTTLSSISINTTIPAGTYTINCNIEVSNNATLTITPGTTLIFSQGMALTVDAGASITALGNSSNPIVFKGSQAIKGYWNGIFINSISNLNQFTYCTISDAGASTGNKFGANVNLTSATASFSNCTVTNSLDAGFYVFGSNVNSAASDDQAVFNTFANNNVTNNGSYPMVTYVAGAGSIGTGNTFTGNANNYIGIRSESDVNVNVTLSPLSIPYQILQLYGTDAGVSFDKVFTVLPGTTIVMGNATSLFAASTGTFIARGTSSSPITFKGLNSTAGYWGSLDIESNTANDFEYCNVSDGGGVSYFDIYSNQRGEISTYMYIDVTRSLTVKNCHISNSGSSGIWVGNDGSGSVAPTYNSDISTSNTFTGCSPNVQM